MALQIDGKTPGELRIARDDGTLATMGEARVWGDGRWKIIYESWRPRVVQIVALNGALSAWETVSTGDTEIADLRNNNHLELLVPVECDHPLATSRNGSTQYPAGTPIPVGQRIYPVASTPADTVHTFTELRT